MKIPILAAGAGASLWTLLAAGLWTLLVAAGGSPWMEWETKPGEPPGALASWPIGSKLPRGGNRARVLLFAHPKCSCTRASVRMLEKFAEEDGASVLVVAWRPEGSRWRPETGLPVWIDEGGAETRRFGAATSGHVAAFDAAGALLFSGGLTESRGGGAAGSGLAALRASLAAGRGASRSRPVFGCGFRGPA